MCFIGVLILSILVPGMYGTRDSRRKEEEGMSGETQQGKDESQTTESTPTTRRREHPET